MTANPKPTTKKKSPEPQSRRAVEFSSWKGTSGIEQGVLGQQHTCPCHLLYDFYKHGLLPSECRKTKGRDHRAASRGSLRLTQAQVENKKGIEFRHLPVSQQLTLSEGMAALTESGNSLGWGTQQKPTLSGAELQWKSRVMSCKLPL